MTWWLLFAGAALISAVYVWSLTDRADLVVKVRTRASSSLTDDAYFHDTVHCLVVNGTVLLFRQNDITWHTPTLSLGAARTLAWHNYDFFMNNRHSRWGYLLGPANMGQSLTVPLAPVALILTTMGWAVYRRDRRLSRLGTCLRCGYDVRNLARDALCPECGAWERIGA